MTEDTKNQFDAPWYVFSSPDDEITVIENESGRVLAELDDVKTANRLARLPELYDALREAAGGKCWSCAGIDVSAILNDGCPKGNDETCDVAKWLDLIRKVRDGK